MGCGGSAVMDLEPIEERANEFATWVGKFDSAQRIPAAFSSAADVPALIAEVKRLRLADHPDNEDCASCTHAYVLDLEEDNDTMTEELLRLREEIARLSRPKFECGTAAAALADLHDLVQRRGVEGGFVKETDTND